MNYDLKKDKNSSKHTVVCKYYSLSSFFQVPSDHSLTNIICVLKDILIFGRLHPLNLDFHSFDFHSFILEMELNLKNYFASYESQYQGLYNPLHIQKIH